MRQNPGRDGKSLRLRQCRAAREHELWTQHYQLHQRRALNAPLSYAMITIFIAGCAIGGACILAYVAIRALPEAFRDFRAFRLERSAVIDTQPVWIKGADRPGRRD